MIAAQAFTAADVNWRLTTAPVGSSRPICTLVIEILPTIEDDLTIDLLEYVALVLCERDDEIRAIQAVQSSTLTLAHSQQAEIVRLRQRNRDLLDARRLEMTAHE